MRAKTINPAKEHIQFVETTKDGAISLEPAEKSFDFISPGAGDRMIFKRSLAERPAVVRAHVVQREHLAADSQQNHDPIVDLDQFSAGIRQVIEFGQPYEVGHGDTVGRRLEVGGAG